MWPLALAIGSVAWVWLNSTFNTPAILAGLPIVAPLYRLGGIWTWSIGAIVSLAFFALAAGVCAAVFRAVVSVAGANAAARFFVSVTELRSLRRPTLIFAMLLIVGSAMATVPSGDALSALGTVIPVIGLGLLLVPQLGLRVDAFPFQGILAAPVLAGPQPGVETEELPGLGPDGDPVMDGQTSGARPLVGDWVLVLSTGGAEQPEGAFRASGTNEETNRRRGRLDEDLYGEDE